MKKAKSGKRKFKKFEVYSLLIFLATLFMSIGYAEITDIEAKITGNASASVQGGVFITNVVTTDTDNSQINYYIKTTLDSEIKLGIASTSTFTYEVSFFNNSSFEYMFIGAIKDETAENVYTNDNIEYTVDAIPYETRISSGGELKIKITFKYKDVSAITSNILKSTLNFRFKEVPTIELSNENESYTLTNIYPDFEHSGYEVAVSNYNTEKVSPVDMKYSFDIQVDDGPISVVMYNGETALSGEQTIDGDGEKKLTNKYTLKVLWDNRKIEDYNSPDYAGKEYKCTVTMNATPVDEKYLGYTITKKFDLTIKTATYSFNASESGSISINNGVASFSLDINNYISDSVYNTFNTNYEISLEGNSEISFTVDDENPVDGIVEKTLTAGKVDNSLTVKFAADMTSLDITENVILKINVIYPYVDVIEIPITITLQTVKVTLNANGGTISPSSLSLYQTRKYTGLSTPTWAGHTFDGWFTEKEGGTQVTSDSIVPSNITSQTLYAHWTSHLLADYVKVGDIVNYPINYTNVTTHDVVPSSNYKGWKVLSIEEDDEIGKYVRIVTGGVPLTYRHPTGSTTSVTNLTTGFFDTSITTSTNNTYNSCGFLNGTSAVTTNTAMLSLFQSNDYAQKDSSGRPIVRAMNKNDVDAVWGKTTVNETYVTTNTLLAIPSTTSGKYASYHLATFCSVNTNYLWNIFHEGAVVYTNGCHGIRPVVSLKPSVETDITGNGTSGWELK